MAFVATAAVIVFWPVTTHRGVNYEVSEQRLPLWRKAKEFLDRDRATARLAARVTVGAAGEEERALAVLRWTNERIRPHPAETQVIDDHVWSIIERGYGANDQQADVFTTLLTYSGVPAYWTLIGPRSPEMPISLALIDGRWRVFDVERRIIFRNERGQLATPDELAAAPQLIRSSAEAARVANADAYVGWFEGFVPPRAPDILRAQLQMPGPRLGFEFRTFLGLRRSR